MCNFIKIEDKKENRKESSNDDWVYNDTCSGCNMHYSMCECRRESNRNIIDICGPDYPPC